MKEKGWTKIFWDRVSEDRDLIFFIIGFFIWLLDFIARLSGFSSNSWPWIMTRAAIPALFISGAVLYLRKHYRLTNQITSIKHLPVVFVVGKPQGEVQEALTSAQEAITELTGFKAFHQVEEIFKVRYEEYLVHHQRKWLQPDASQWKDFIEDAELNIHRFSDTVSGGKIYHIFIDGPASLALGLGVVFGSKRQLVVYQFQDNKYQPVIDLRQNLRRIKEAITETEYQYIQVSYPPSFTPDIAVVLDMASHPAVGYVKAHLTRVGHQMEIVEVSNTYRGNLTGNDWVKVVQELYSVFRRLQSREEIARLHVFHSMPVAMAFGLGMALGNFVPIRVYNWEKSEATYYPVLKLNELGSFL